MKRPFTLVAAAVLGIAIPLVATPGAYAAVGSPPLFRAAVDTWSYDIEGIGDKAGWHYRESMKDATMVLPSYAETYRLYKSYFQGGKPRTFLDRYLVVNGRSYEKVNNTPRWKITKLTARQISYAQTYNPVIELDMFLSLPGVTQAGPATTG